MTMIAKWSGTEIARSNNTVVVEGNHYFPLADVVQSALEPSAKSTHCPWKGDASYYSIRVGENVNVDAAWYYAAPKDAAEQIKGRIAFWKGVQVSQV